MRISRQIDLVGVPAKPSRKWIGWAVVVVLSAIELLANLHGRPSIIKSTEALAGFVDLMSQMSPMVQSFARCAARGDVGSGLMLALNVAFYPLKLAALCYAHPANIRIQGNRSRRFFGEAYAFLIALVALVPTYIWVWRFSSGDMGLASVNRRTHALCAGGYPAYFAALLESGLSLLCAYVSAVLLLAIFRRN